MSKGYDYRADMLATHQPKPPRPQRRPSPPKAKQIAIVRELASLGCTMRRAGELIERSHVTVWNLAKSGGVKFGREESTLRQAIRAGYAAKKSPSQIASDTGRDASSIKVLASRMGLTKGRTPDPGKFRRGFEIPDAMREEYRFLTQVKGLKAREAGEILGLVERPVPGRYTGPDQEAPRP